MGFGFLGIGALYEDTLLSLPWYPEEDQKLRATSLTTRVGGNIPNTLNVLGQVATPEDRLIFLSVYADKTVSRRLTDTLAQKSVEVEGIWRNCPENPQSWILKSDKSGSRTIVNYNGVEEFTEQELVNAVASIKNLEEITWVHFEGRIPDVLKLAIPKIRELLSHATISIEFEKPDRPGLLELVPVPDVAFYSHTFYKHWQSIHPLLTPPLELFFISSRTFNPTASLVLTAGAEGAYWYDPGWGQGAAPTTYVDLVDSTGAGDTFIAGFIWARGKLKKNVKESAEVAVELATRKVAQEGFDGVWESL